LYVAEASTPLRMRALSGSIPRHDGPYVTMLGRYMTIKGLCRLHSQPAALSTMATSTVGLPRAPPDATPRHTWTVNGAGCDFTVDAKYTPGKLLGKGSYGVVASAYDEEKKRKVAIKCVPKVFDDEVDALRVLREIKLLRRLNHPNIIKLEDIVQPISEHGFASLHIVMEYMESDLHKIIHSKPKQLTIDHVRFILAQLLSGISHLKKAHVVHRDLKPSNILVNSACEIRVCDLGLARGLHDERDHVDLLTEYVVTRWYRAPEVLCSLPYSYPVDMFGLDLWAVGCIFAEMVRGEPLFAGENAVDMLKRIVSVGQSPMVVGTREMTKLRLRVSHPQARKFMDALPFADGTPMHRLFPGLDRNGLNLIESMLKVIPDERISVDDALRHPFLGEFASVMRVLSYDVVLRLIPARACRRTWRRRSHRSTSPGSSRPSAPMAFVG
ncbi:hypothetical protein PBRA_001294, partial [Plasmodiophora brassicae]